MDRFRHIRTQAQWPRDRLAEDRARGRRTFSINPAHHPSLNPVRLRIPAAACLTVACLTVVCLIVVCPIVTAQESAPANPVGGGATETTTNTETAFSGPVVPPPPSPLAGFNPALLRRMRGELSFELRQIRQTLALIDPRDTQLKQTLQTQQAELVSQLKEITVQLESAGVSPLANEPGLPEMPDEKELAEGPGIPPLPPGTRTIRIPPRSLREGWPPDWEPDPAPGFATEPGASLVPPEMTLPLRQPAPGFGYDGYDALSSSLSSPLPPRPVYPPGPSEDTPVGDMARNAARTAAHDATWDVPPLKEIVALKTTVHALQNEIEAMRADIKALETQLRLLNQNVLLQSQGKAEKQ